MSSNATTMPSAPIPSTMAKKPSDSKAMDAKEEAMEHKDVPKLDPMHFQPTINIGTLGHVAHGKSTLTQKLSGVSTGRFHREKEQNMTIKLGYANVKIFKCRNPLCPPPWCYQSAGSVQMEELQCLRPGCNSLARLVRHVSFVDSPGHHDLMATMLSGASVMDGAVLVVAANEACPCPQTSEHLAAADMLGISKNLIVLQNKIDLCEPRDAAKNYLEIKEFLQGTLADNAPVIPVASQQGVNLDIVLQYLAEKIPEPKRDTASPAQMLLVRSFDVNKPGKDVSSLQGGVVGGSIIRGSLRKGQLVEIRPGIIRAGKCTPLITTVTSLLSEKQQLDEAFPGGLIGVGLTIDPALTKGDRLVGQVLGAAGTLPPIFSQCVLAFKQMQQPGQAKLPKPKKGEKFLLCLGSNRVDATVAATKPGHLKLTLDIPVCASLKEKVALFRQLDRHWRLFGAGSIVSITELEPQVDPEPSVVVEAAQEEAKAATPAAAPAVDEALLKAAIAPEEAPAELANDNVLEKEAEGGADKIKIVHKSDQCRMYPDELPQVGEVVMVRVTEANLEVGATCELLEYNHISGLVIATELSRKRIRSVKQVIGLGKEEAVVVLRVDRSGIDLSKRRLEEGDAPKAKTRFAKSKIVHSIFNRVGVVLGIPLLELYESFGWAMYRRDEDDESDEIHHPLDDFHLAMHDPALVFGKYQAQIQALNAKYQLKAGSGVLELLMACIGHRLQLKPVRVQAELEATCFSKQGVTALHHAFLPFREAPKTKKDKKQTAAPTSVAEELADELLVRVCTKASPIYAIYAVSHDKMKALAAIKNITNTVQTRLAQHGGQAIMSKEPKISI